jgi:ABC-type multidrug transport system ATPase subunit
VVKRLRLGSCVNTPIKLISGGEKKRTNIGTELLTNPRMLMLDEPTSGLDSTSAVALLKTLHDLAAEGRTILTSIHQPSSGVFAA